MKKLLFVISILSLFIGINTQAQERDIFYRSMPSVRLDGVDTATVIFPNMVSNWNASFQIDGVRYAAGDSIQAAVAFYQSNSLTGDNWTLVKADTILAVAARKSILYEKTDFLGLRMKVEIKSYSSFTDTVTYTPYVVYRKVP